MDRGVILGVADRKMTHETKEDEDDLWTRVVSCVSGACREGVMEASFKTVLTEERVKQID
jgi:hypothetical protein